MTYLPFLSAAILAVLGTLHLIYTVHDAVRVPKYFVPRDKALLPAMRQTKVALAPGGHDYWDALVGFHFSHSIGILLLATMIALETVYPTGWLRPLLCGVGAAYVLIAWRYWFRTPLIGVAIATLAMTAAWIAALL
jgi:hypothetical protein